MAILKLERIRYDGPAASSSESPPGRVFLESGDRQAESEFTPLESGRSYAVEEALHGEASLEFRFRGSAKVEVIVGGQSVGSFWVWDNEVTPERAANSWKQVGASGGFYTLSYRVKDRHRDIGVDRPGERIEESLPALAPDATLVESSVARVGWNSVVPPEVGFVFAPRYNRRHLEYVGGVNDDKKVTVAADRAAYKAWVNQAPIKRWVGPHEVDVTVGAVTKKVTMRVSEPSDATGAFQIGAQEFVAYWERAPLSSSTIEYVEIDNGIDGALALGGRLPSHDGEGDIPHSGYRQRLDQVLAHLDAYPRTAPLLSFVAFFCHGWDSPTEGKGLQLGLSDMDNAAGGQAVTDLVNSIKAKSRQDVVVVLYCCATGRSNSASLAARIRDLLVTPPNEKPYCRVVGHTEVAHAYWTADIRFFEGVDRAGALGKDVPLDGRLHSAFAHHVGEHSPTPNFRWAFPFMPIAEIERYLGLPEDERDGMYQHSQVTQVTG